jgi:hypothetical protein
MSINWQKAGANHVPAYQISGVPYVTGSSGAAEHLNAPKEFTFPFVTKNISFFAEANALHFGFSHHGVNGEPSNNFPVLTGSINGAAAFEGIG